MKYERLTEKDRYWKDEEWWTTSQEPTVEEIDEIYNRLAELEDKIDNGTLVELPCKSGDTAYEVIGGKIIEGKISMLYCTSEGRWKVRFTYQLQSYKTRSLHDLYIDDACVFLTQAEAEKKLDKLKGEGQ